MSGEDGLVRPPADVAAYGDVVAAALGSVLGDDLVGVYFVGSVALGGYVAGRSDIDVVAVCAHPLALAARSELADRVTGTSLDCPTRGLELTLYRAEVAAAETGEAAFEVNVNVGPQMPRDVHLSPRTQPRFWFVLDRALAHRRGMAICGPPAADVFADASRRLLLDVLGESLRWHREHEPASLYSVLNASRAWRFAVEDVLGSKLEGAAWARGRWTSPTLIDAAVELRHGRPARLDAAEVDRFLDHVERAIATAE